MKSKFSNSFLLGFIVSMLLALMQTGWAPKAQAAYEGGWLIDDAVFLNAKAMNANQIQSFLSSKGSGLATRSFKLQCYGANSKERQWYTEVGAPCDQSISAARIIYYASQVYGVNPQVVLATLQKEQSLITTKNPTSWQINQAMGYACPTSGNCSGNSTFSYQIDSGVWALRYHYERANRNYNWWSPSSNNYWVCGSKKHLYSPSLYPSQRVTFYDTNGVQYRIHLIKNAATAAMYCYTPHAYNNPQGLYGLPRFGHTGLYYTGSYNFVSAFESWFGSTRSNAKYTSMKSPRWMKTKTDIRKRNPFTEEAIDVTIEAGRQIYFRDKIKINGKEYLRTKHDYDRGLAKGILLSDLKEVEIKFEPLKIPRWMETREPIKKKSPRTNQHVDGTLQKGRQIYFDTKVSIGGEWFLRTRHDTKRGEEKGIPLTELQETNVEYEPFQKPRWMESSTQTGIYDVKDNIFTSKNLTQGQHIYLDTKLTINGKTYGRSGAPASNDEFAGAPLDDLREIPVRFLSLQKPRAMKVKVNLHKVDPITGEKLDKIIPAGTIIYFPTKIQIGNEQYLRTKHDTDRNYAKGIGFSDLEEIPLDYAPLLRPRWMTLVRDVHKKDPVTGQDIDKLLPAGTRIYFPTKIEINGNTYVRTKHDTDKGLYKGILLSDLR